LGEHFELVFKCVAVIESHLVEVDRSENIFGDANLLRLQPFVQFSDFLAISLIKSHFNVCFGLLFRLNERFEILDAFADQINIGYFSLLEKLRRYGLLILISSE
jgi:hypothetical protein